MRSRSETVCCCRCRCLLWLLSSRKRVRLQNPRKSSHYTHARAHGEHGVITALDEYIEQADVYMSLYRPDLSSSGTSSRAGLHDTGNAIIKEIILSDNVYMASCGAAPFCAKPSGLVSVYIIDVLLANKILSNLTCILVNERVSLSSMGMGFIRIRKEPCGWTL